MPADPSQPDLHIVLLAAGKGTRMNSAVPKVLHRAGGLPLIDHVAASAAALKPTSIVVVIGHQTEQLREHLARRPDVARGVAGATARNGACASSGRAVPAGKNGHGPPLVGGRATPARRHRPDTRQPSHEPSGGCHGPDRDRRAAGRLRPHRPRRGLDFCDHRAQGRVSRRAGHRGNQQRRLRVRPGAAFRGPAASGVGERSGRVLSS